MFRAEPLTPAGPGGTISARAWERRPQVLFADGGPDGWRMCGPGFDIVDGVLTSRGGMGLLWYAVQEFGDSTLAFDWRVRRGEDNSGVFLRFPSLATIPGLRYGTAMRCSEESNHQHRRG
jgi:hypothetical protein